MKQQALLSHLDHLLKLRPEIKDGAILDIGTGDGEFLIECFDRGFRVSGLEINQTRVDTIKKMRPGITIVQGLAEHLPYEDQSLDFINLCEVIEHVVDPAQVLREAYRVLKPDGRIYLSFPNRFSFYDTHYHVRFVNWLPRFMADGYIRLIGKQKPEGGVDLQKLSQMHYYTWGGFRRLARACGLSVEDTRLRRLLGKPLVRLVYPFIAPWYFRASHALLSREN